MREYIELRVLKTAEYIAENMVTVREAAKAFGVSKSTVHKDMHERLKELDRSLFDDVRQVLNLNKAERHLRGGHATREKYKHVEFIKNMSKK
ncbi:MAG: sporulation transcriptional regulator SpoIIID [Firmicutes bacterium]|nr:sporulation transcriptional regulator SpoIIID [Bacillota bacterium]